jgi:hypothetical protein
MVAYVLFIWCKCKGLFQASLALSKVTPFNMNNTQIVLALYMARVNFKDPKKI